MFIIEGLGSIKAIEWGKLVQTRLGLPNEALKFLLYHGENDAAHMEEFAEMLRMVLPDEALSENLLGLSFLSKLKRFEYANGQMVLEQ